MVTFDDFVEMVTPRITGRDAREEIMKVLIPLRASMDARYCNDFFRYIFTYFF